MAEVKLYDPRDLDQESWLQLQTMARAAYAHMLQSRSQEEIDALVGWDDPARYYRSHRDPNYEVGRRFKDNQAYSHQRVAIALDLHEPVGFAYSAHNVSGETDQIRARKRLTIVHNYLWLREFVVTPQYDLQRTGIATQMGRKLLRHAIPMQPVSTYIWPGEIPFLQGKLESLGFEQTGEAVPVELYGAASEPVDQVRMQANTAIGVLLKL
jgi:hypothetical protein